VEFYVSQIINGIATGSVYGLFGLSIMFIYRSTRVINLAQGAMATATTILTFTLLKTMPAWLAVLSGLSFAFFLGVFLETTIMKLLKERSELNSTVVMIGLFAIINSVDQWIFGTEAQPFPSPISDEIIKWHDFAISNQSIWIMGCALVMSLLLYALFKFTSIGIAFQAMSEDEMATRLKGVRVGPLISIGWGISSIFGAIAAMLIAHTLFLSADLMSTPLLYGFVAAIVGGLQTSFGAIFGGIVIGIIENLAGTWAPVGSSLKIVVVCLVMIVFLVIKPRGIFGRDEPRKM